MIWNKLPNARGNLLALALATASAVPVAAQDNEPIKLGAIVSLTGPVASTAAPVKLGFEIAFNDIKRMGGIAGRPLEVVWGDDQGNPTAGVNEARRLTQNEKVVAIAGNAISQVNLAMLPIFNQAKVLSVSNTGSTLLTPEAGPYHFSMLPPAALQGEKLVDFAMDVMGAKSVAVLHDNGAIALSGVEGVEAHAKKRNLPIVAKQQYEYLSTDITPQLLSLRRSNPDLIFLMAGGAPDIGYILRNRDDLGWDIPILANSTAAQNVDGVLKVASPDLFEDVYAINFKSFSYCAGEDEAGRPKVAEFIGRLREMRPNDYATLPLSNIAAMYDAVFLIKAAIEGAGTTDGSALAQWVVKNASTYEGVTGSLVASGQSHFLIKDDALTVVSRPEQVNKNGLQARADCKK